LNLWLVGWERVGIVDEPHGSIDDARLHHVERQAECFADFRKRKVAMKRERRGELDCRLDFNTADRCARWRDAILCRGSSGHVSAPFGL